ncbi:MAG: phosphoribosylaminoimidazolesuccinocarboxamide synthase [Nitrosomonadales bacterium]|nr:phosphoribosylaminoimidazolesuccinocarboxamide synthase [Nitrosomonadales bacterium]MBT6817627.1 phosphoribosylaminoimidazolesuccinocarboxamide synthase [Nitrosomonadales bacterium]MBT7407428.1 phosphoribosylaminoimidazolesuccinocarboxamide synthase [Nitrosomonadales bacterium]
MSNKSELDIQSLPLLHQGKVRDIYDINQDKMLIVTTDRISAFDVIMDEAIPYKGKVLTQMANFWFKQIESIVPNHLIDEDVKNFISQEEAIRVKHRAVVVKKLTPVPIEAIVRGYVVGSGWKEYQRDQSVCHINLPSGLKLASRLPQAIFTPSNKAAVGDHDENISISECIKLIGDDLTNQISKISLEIYKKAYDTAIKKGIMIADTKFEFGTDDTGELYLMDEVLTPDSSRFWSEKNYQVGTSPHSFDKQFIRDWLESQDWDKAPPPPTLPENIIQKTSQKYLDIFERLTGEKVIL